MKGGNDVIYTVKWIEENLGITRRMLRHYEQNNLIPSTSRNLLNNYREYNEEEVNKIWAIKVLIGIGYTVKEIQEIINNPKFDFYESLSKKIEILEKENDERAKLLQFAKTIKITGQIPTVNNVGSIKFEDFMSVATENWNIYSDGKALAIAKMIEEPSNIFVPDNIELLEELSKNSIAFMSHAYLNAIVKLKKYGYKSEIIQELVQMLYELIRDIVDDVRYTPKYFAKSMIPSFSEGDIYVENEKHFGKEGCMFIIQAISFFAIKES